MSKPTPSVLNRRTALAGAGVAGAAAAAVSLLPRTPAAPVVAEAVPVKAPEGGGGYRESDHVLHYYRTTRV